MILTIYAGYRIKKAAKAEKYQNAMRTVKVEEHFTQPDFELVFGNSGTLIQPTPTNKVYYRSDYSNSKLTLFTANIVGLDTPLQVRSRPPSPLRRLVQT